MKGYWNNPAATAEVLKDGWLLTGDIGHLDAAGHLKITDRKKDIIVTAGGKNVAPQNLENDLKTDPLISQVMVHGDKRKFLSALVTLNEENARKWAADNGVPRGREAPRAPGDRSRGSSRPSTRSTPGRRATRRSSASRSSPNDFTQETGELTPTLKVKRKVVTQKYQAVLDAFYVE